MSQNIILKISHVTILKVNQNFLPSSITSELSEPPAQDIRQCSMRVT